jgi:hypothetical protein
MVTNKANEMTSSLTSVVRDAQGSIANHNEISFKRKVEIDHNEILFNFFRADREIFFFSSKMNFL